MIYLIEVYTKVGEKTVLLKPQIEADSLENAVKQVLESTPKCLIMNVWQSVEFRHLECLNKEKSQSNKTEIKTCKCGATTFYSQKNGNQTGLYCSNCGKWQKWLSKNEVRVFEHNLN